MGRAQQAKGALVDAIKANFEKATASVLLNFKGLDVASDMELRIAFRKAGVDYKVVKNTLIRRAIEGTDLDNEAFKANLVGQTAIAWSYEDPSAAAKVVKAFRADELNAAKLNVKCGVLDSVLLDANRVERELATMPGKDEVRAMFLAQLMAPMQSLVRQLNAPGQNLAFAVQARQRQLEEQG